MFLGCCVLPDKKLYGNRLYWCKYMSDINGALQRLKAKVPDPRVWLPAPACVIVAVRLSKALKHAHSRGQAICTSCAQLLLKITPREMKHALKMHVPVCLSIRIVSYSYTVIVPCTVLYDIPINVACKTLSKYFIQVLSFVTLVHITQTATRVGPSYTLHSRNWLQNFPTSASQLKFDVKINVATDNRRVLKKARKTWH